MVRRSDEAVLESQPISNTIDADQVRMYSSLSNLCFVSENSHIQSLVPIVMISFLLNYVFKHFSVLIGSIFFYRAVEEKYRDDARTYYPKSRYK